jgi:putative membrane protein
MSKDPNEESDHPSKNELAEDRTEWAQQRTLLAKERTFSAWTRTGLSCMAAGLGIARLLSDIESLWVARSLGAILIVTGGVIFALGFISYRRALIKLEEENIRSTSIWLIGVITLAMGLGSVLALILIFVE